MFSIIIPTYNRAEKLKKCLDSLLNQTYKDFEVIISDDGSADNTAAVVEEAHAKGLLIRYIYNPNWGGPARPRNIGIKHAGFEWVCFLDSDDWWHADKLEKILPYCNEGYDFIYHDFRLYTNGQATTRRLRGRQLKSPVFDDLLVNDNCIVNSSVCARKSIIEQAGGFNEDKDMIVIEDYDLWLKCSRITEKFKYIPEILGGYNAGSDSISNIDDRLIQRLNKLFSYYKQFIKPKQIRLAEINWSYKKAVIYQKMLRLNDARKYYAIALKSRVISIKIKAFIRLVSLSFKK